MCIYLDSLTRYSELSISTTMGDKKGERVLGASVNLYFINLLTYYYILKKVVSISFHCKFCVREKRVPFKEI